MIGHHPHLSFIRVLCASQMITFIYEIVSILIAVAVRITIVQAKQPNIFFVG